MITIENDGKKLEFDLPEVEARCIDFKGYLGNALLKRAGVQIEWTPESLAEYTKCRDDPVYFIENYMKVIHVDHGLVPFKLRQYQHTLVQNVHEHRRNIITMARQSGKCLKHSNFINLKNKKTGKCCRMTIGEFYEMQKRKLSKQVK